MGCRVTGEDAPRAVFYTIPKMEPICDKRRLLYCVKQFYSDPLLCATRGLVSE